MSDLRQAAQQALEALESLQGGCTDHDDGTVEAITVWCPEVIDALRTALEQQAEPVAWMDREGDLYKMPEILNWAPPHTMLYTTPPQRQWVGLTDEEIQELRKNFATLPAIRAIETKLKERNNG